MCAGVGGIEAEAVMLGQPISMVLPEVVGYRLCGTADKLITSTDIVLTVTKVAATDLSVCVISLRCVVCDDGTLWCCL